MEENMEKITEIFIVLENCPSTLGELCSYLAENKVNIEAIGVFQDNKNLGNFFHVFLHFLLNIQVH